MSSVPNYVKFRIHAIDKQKTDYVIVRTTEIYLVVNTIKKFHIQSSLHFFYQQNIYHDKQEIMDELFHQYHIYLLKCIDNPAFITE